LALKIKSSKDLLNNSFILDEAIQIARRFIKRSFGTLGSHEFRIDDTKYDRRSNAFKIILIRDIDGLSIRYELTIDVESGEPVRFRRLE
jgi:hypothetical protein